MKKLIALGFCIMWISAYSQNNNLVEVLDPSVNPAGIIDELKLPPAPTTGNVYLNDDWQQGNIVLEGSRKINGQLLRYDLKHKHLEIKLGEEIKVCPLSLLKSFSWYNRELNDSAYFVNIKQVPNQLEFYDRCILEILYEEKANLYKQYYLEVQESTYVPAVDMGRRSDKIVKKSSLLLQSQGKFYPLSKSMKNNKKAFGEEFDEVEKFAKENRLKLKNEADVLGIVGHYNLLLEH